jgi:acetamidase/formamidase
MFGCGEIQRDFSFDGELLDAIVDRRQSDRLRHSETIDQVLLDRFFTERGRSRRSLLKATGLMGLLSASPLLQVPRRAAAAHAPGESRRGQPSVAEGATDSPSTAGGAPTDVLPAFTAQGRVHTVPSTAETVRSGVFDSTLPNVLDIDSGDVVIYPNTWTHYLNNLQPGLTIEELLKIRGGGGGHSIIGPVGVRGAEPGDVIAVHFQRLLPIDWGVNYNAPGSLGSGTLPAEFPDGQLHYFDLDTEAMTTEFLPGIMLPLGPFQGVFATAPQAGGIASSVPPGPYGGNMDLRDLTEGSTLYLPVWQDGAKLYTGDSHALQGDGEVNVTAVETAMREVRIKVELHKQVGWQWPFAETDSHWYALGMDPDLNEALRIALRNAIDFLELRAGLSRLDAYSLASVAVNFRITQSVDINKGVHAMIPKAIFSDQLRRTITVV